MAFGMACQSRDLFGDVINLNVGGTRFSTSKQTLTWVPDSFFTSMLSGRISSLRDETGAIFIDRDPLLFSRVLNYLRTRELDLHGVDLRTLLHEAEFYGVTPLVRRIHMCMSLEQPACGDILFHGFIPAPKPPKRPTSQQDRTESESSFEDDYSAVLPPRNAESLDRQLTDSKLRLNNHNSRHSYPGEASGECKHVCRLPSSDVSASLGSNPIRVTLLKGHFNWIAAAYPHFVCLYRLKDAQIWSLTWTSPYMEHEVERIALNAKVANPSQEHCNRMLAAAEYTYVHLWSIGDDGNTREVGQFNFTVHPEHLFFIGSQLVALSSVGKVGVWNAMTQNWQIQDVVAICSYDTAGSFLLLGCENGSIYYIDMQKFPLRMKDNDLLVTELYKDPASEMVTALSVYLTPKTTLSGNWIEIAYGTNKGTVRVIVQHPETVGQGPQLFQTFTVHRKPIQKVMLSEKHLISVCQEYNHVRSWSVTRFRGMISTQPGSMPLASFKVISLEDFEPCPQYEAGNSIGPYGEKDDQQVFVQKLVPQTDRLFVRLASNGKRVCMVKSVNGCDLSCFCVHECEGSSRMGSRPRRYLFTGHENGTIQMWDLSTALDLMTKKEEDTDLSGPTPQELMEQLDYCDLTNSCAPTPNLSPSPSLLGTESPQLAVRGLGSSTPERRKRANLSSSDPRIARF